MICPGCALGYHCDGDDADPDEPCTCECAPPGRALRSDLLRIIEEGIEEGGEE